MASVNSPFRLFIKPLLYKLLGENNYAYFLYLGKIRDIEKKLVEEDELELLPQLLTDTDEVIDIGANYAYYTHRLANICTKGRVYAFEPIPFTYKVCSMIIKKYGFNNVRLYQKGVGDKNEFVAFNVPILDFGGISAGQAHLNTRNNELAGKEQHYKFTQSKVITCEVVTIDTFLQELTNLTYVKIDIEGAELFALRGMLKTIQKFLPVILIEINPFFLQGFGLQEQEIRHFFAELGYSFYIYNKSSGKISSYPSDNFVERNYLVLHNKHLEKYSHLIVS